MATTANTALKGALGKMLGFSSVAAIPVAFATVFGCLMTIEIPPNSFGRLMISIGIVTGVLVGPVNFAYFRLTSTLKDIGEGKKPGTVAELKQVAREVMRLPGVVFWVNASCWVFGGSMCVIIFKGL